MFVFLFPCYHLSHLTTVWTEIDHCVIVISAPAKLSTLLVNYSDCEYSDTLLSHLSWEGGMSVMLTHLHLCPHSWHSALSHSGQTFARNLPISHRTLYLISNTSKIICQNKSLLPLKYPFHSIAKQSVLWYRVFVQRITVDTKSIKLFASLLLLNSTKERVWSATQRVEVLIATVSLLITIQSVNPLALFALILVPLDAGNYGQ